MRRLRFASACGRGNRDTELALARLLRANHISGWRRQQKLRIEGKKRRAGPARPTGARQPERRARRSRPTNVGIDFVFPKERVVVFVDGCFWHGCPIHSNPKKWLKKSSMGDPPSPRLRRTGPPSPRLPASLKLRRTRGGAVGHHALPTTGATTRTGKAFWAGKLAANIARDRFVNRTLRKQGWRVVRIWEHELSKTPERCLHRIRNAMMPVTDRYHCRVA
jgi:DNA mismatch endonuclease (patch repair protein)